MLKKLEAMREELYGPDGVQHVLPKELQNPEIKNQDINFFQEEFMTVEHNYGMTQMVSEMPT